jgi:hypothetical protein
MRPPVGAYPAVESTQIFCHDARVWLGHDHIRRGDYHLAVSRLP